jgi:hypothetical protein
MKKLKLDDLEIKSFVTSLAIKAGGINENDVQGQVRSAVKAECSTYGTLCESGGTCTVYSIFLTICPK